MTTQEDNTVMVRKREREIQKIVQSISELNTIFKDLATMVTEQVRSRITIWRLWQAVPVGDLYEDLLG